MTKISPGKKLLQSWGLPLLLLGLVFVFRWWYFQNNFEAGETAADFSGQLLDGSDFQLSQLRGDYVLLDFWGSWCRPCRAEAPELRALHQEAGDRLQIVSVAIERNSEHWQTAIAQDQRNWPYHLMDATSSLKFLNGPISDLYGVNQVPTHFLINPAGEVVGVDLSWREILSEIK
ncbi:MAG: TlpA disulfide reductase family protein [Bacteroidota bacterium]